MGRTKGSETMTAAQRDRKQQLLTQPAPSRAGGIAEAAVIKDAGIYFLCRPDGCVPGTENHGLGLYYHDCRYLCRYELYLAGEPPESLAASSADGFRSIFQLTNPEIESEEARLGRQEIGIRWRHVIDAGDLALRDELVIQNYHTREHTVPLTLVFDADFADIFTIRGLVQDRPGTLHPPRWDSEGLVFAYDGSDGRARRLVIRFSDSPARFDGHSVTFRLRLAPQEERRLVVSLSIVEHSGDAPPREVPSGTQGVEDAEDAFQRSIGEWLREFTAVRSGSARLGRVMDRSLRDLRALGMKLDGNRFFAAGVPWFATLFGRDSLLCGLQTLAYRPEVAAETLRLVAKLQGRNVDPWRDEQPGKILHELRVGELARNGSIPHTPYYGSVDATPLFLILLGEHARWTGSLALFRELRECVQAALDWMERYGDSDGDGYIDYRSEAGSSGGLVNQGWKDSGDAIVTRNGALARPPVALVEVQGYAYLAKKRIADLLRRNGEDEGAERMEREAEDLRARFNRDYWLEEAGYLALALHGGRREPLDVISSNAGHALWTGIVSEERARRVARRLMEDDLYSGWGIRTLSSRERAYNPVGYHLGTVWPHDNAIIVAGLRRYGFDSEARRVFSDLVEASTYFEHDRLPEAFSGFPRSGYGVPVRYPVACHPQAWAAGSVPFMLQELLGLRPDAFERRLYVVHPCLPDFVHDLHLQGLRVGEASVDLRFERTREGIAVHTDGVKGELEVIVRDGSRYSSSA